MKKHFAYSKRLHLATLCCFLLPFFYFTGCGPSAEEKAAREKATQDSIIAVEKTMTTNVFVKPDTINKERIKENVSDTTIQTKESTPIAREPEKEDKSKSNSEKISDKYGFLSPILIPKPNTYTGLASIIDTTSLAFLASIFISFLLLIISLVVKFIESKARKTTVLLNFLSLIFLLFSRPYSYDYNILWGYWVAISFVALLTAYDVVIIIIAKKNSTQRTQN